MPDNFLETCARLSDERGKARQAVDALFESKHPMRYVFGVQLDLYGLVLCRQAAVTRPAYRLDRVPKLGNAKVGYNSKPPLASRRRFGTESTGR